MASFATMKRYNLNDFESIIDNGFNCELPAEIISIIQELAEKVGAPEYIKTPQFVRKDRNDSSYRQQRRKRGKRAVTELSDAAWQEIRNFEATKREEREGIDKSIDNVRKAMNKISDKTYDTLKTKIFTELASIISSGIEVEGEDMIKLVDSLFNIASQNGFYSELYAKLYSELIVDYDFIKNPLDKSVSEFIGDINTISYTCSDDDYDQFCQNNKNNNRRRARSMFFINCYKHSLVEGSNIIDIINEIQSRIEEYIHIEDKSEIVSELSEMLGETLPAFISATGTRSDDSFNEAIAELITDVEKISKMSSKNYPSLPNKAVFKYMDILECDEVDSFSES